MNSPALTSLAALAALALPLGLPVAGTAQSIELADVLTAQLRPGWRTAQGTHMAALDISLAAGWKTYWRSPGDAGIPPRFDWSGSENVESVAFHWPRPIVFDQLGMRSIGYRDELVLPMEFALRDAGAPARIEATIEIGVCESVCLPATLRLQAELPPAGAPDPRIGAALDARPESARAAGLSSAGCAVEPISDGLRVTASLEMPPVGAREVAVFELSDKSVWISDTTSRREGGRLTASAEMVPVSAAPFALDRSDLRITVLGEQRAAELHGCAAG